MTVGELQSLLAHIESNQQRMDVSYKQIGMHGGVTLPALEAGKKDTLIFIETDKMRVATDALRRQLREDEGAVRLQLISESESGDKLTQKWLKQKCAEHCLAQNKSKEDVEALSTIEFSLLIRPKPAQPKQRSLSKSPAADRKPSHFSKMFEHAATVLGKEKETANALDFRTIKEDPELQKRYENLLANDPEYQALVKAWTKKWSYKFKEVSANFEAAKDDLAELGFIRPDSIEDFEHLALVIGIDDPGAETPRTIYEKAVAWADRQRLQGRWAAAGIAQVVEDIRGKNNKAEVEADERIKLIGKTGSGLYGVVWEAEQTHLRRRVAVKIINPDMQNRANALAHARVLAKVDSHENIVTVYDVAKVKGDQFPDPVDAVVMEWLSGENLEAKLNGKVLDLELAFRICGGLIEGVRFMHANEIAHGDLHPGNLMICNTATKLIDIDATNDFSAMRQTSMSLDSLKKSDVEAVGYIVTRVFRKSKVDLGRYCDSELKIRQASHLDEIQSLIELL